MEMQEKVLEYELEKERQELLEHRDVLLAIGVLLKQKEGLQLFKYLFKYFNLLELPYKGLEDNELHDNLGFLRAGNAFYKLVCEADFDIAASILSKLEREKYDDIHQQHAITN